jgi:hypothetical protein
LVTEGAHAQPRSGLDNENAFSRLRLWGFKVSPTLGKRRSKHVERYRGRTGYPIRGNACDLREFGNIHFTAELKDRVELASFRREKSLHQRGLASGCHFVIAGMGLDN